MKYLVIVLTVLLAATVCLAERLTIAKLNTSTIDIGGRVLKEGDTFDENDTIKWSSDRQAMKVVSRSRGVFIVSKGMLKQGGHKGFADFISNNKSAIVRNIGSLPATLEQHRRALEDNFVIMSPLTIRTGWTIDSKSYFTAETHTDNSMIRRQIPHKGLSLIFDANFIKQFTDSESVTLTIKYIEREYNDTTIITKDMHITIVPTTLK